MREKDLLVSDFTKSLNGTIMTFMKDSREKFDVEYQKTNEAVSAQEKEIETLHATLGQFFANMNSMIDKARTNVQEIKGGTAGMAQNRKSVDEKLSVWSNEITSHGERYQTFVDNEKRLDVGLRKIMTDSQKTNTTVINKVQDCTKTVTSDVKCSLTTLDTNVSSTLQFISGALHTQNDEIADLDTKLNKATHEKLTESGTLVQKCNASMTGVATNTASLLNCLTKGISTHESSTKTQLLTISDDAEKFRRNEVKTYQSTGMTPARKEYRIIRDLAATSPHDRIIRKFTLDNNASELDSSIVSEVRVVN